MNDDGNIVDFNWANATDSFNFKIKMTDQTDDDVEIANIEITIPLKYLSNFWITLEMPLFNYVVNLIFTLSENFVIVCTNIANQGAKLEIKYAKLYASVITLSNQDNEKLLQQLKSGFKRTINWNEYLAKPELLRQNSNLSHLVELSFQG